MRKTTLLQITIACMTVSIILATFVPIVARSTRLSQSDFPPIYIHNFLEDYEIYLSAITRGQYGLLFADPFNIPHRATRLILSLYSIAGMITGPFHIWPPIVYHSTRIILIAGLIYAIYFLFRIVFENDFWASVGTLISIVLTSPPRFLPFSTITSSFQSWWQDFSPVNRFNNPPHHLAAQLFLLISIAFFFRFIKTKSWIYAVISSCFSAIGVLMVPHIGVVYMSILWIYVGLQVLQSGFRIQAFRSVLKPIVFVSLMSILPVFALYIIWTGTHDAFWIANRIWEVNYWRQDPFVYYHYYLLHLFLLVPACVGFVLWIRKSRTIPVLLIFWVFTPLLFAHLIEIIGSGSGRFVVQTNIYIPLTILTTYAVRELFKSRIGKIISMVCVLLLSLYGIHDAYYNVQTEWDRTRTEAFSTKFYPLRSYFELVTWVKTNIPKNTVMIAGPELGSLIAAQAPVFMYVGDVTHGSNWDLAMDNINTFYARGMTPEAAKLWLADMNVQYVVQDVNMGWQPEAPLPYPFLKIIWSNDITGVYRIL